jgi:hypothetical protein
MPAKISQQDSQQDCRWPFGMESRACGVEVKVWEGNAGVTFSASVSSEKNNNY